MSTVYNVYCDESRVTSNIEDPFMAIGGVMCPVSEKTKIVRRIDEARFCFGVQGEFGWKTVSPAKLGFFLTVVDLFFDSAALSYRGVVVNRRRTSFKDDEDRFQRVYYQVFNHWLCRSDRYRVFLDRRTDRAERITILRRCLIGTRYFGDSVLFVEEVESKENNLIQLADLLTGALCYAWNGRAGREGSSEAKTRLCEHVAGRLGISSLEGHKTPAGENKFNVFHFGER